jgi:hypothetical protein
MSLSAAIAKSVAEKAVKPHAYDAANGRNAARRASRLFLATAAVAITGALGGMLALGGFLAVVFGAGPAALYTGLVLFAAGGIASRAGGWLLGGTLEKHQNDIAGWGHDLKVFDDPPSGFKAPQPAQKSFNPAAAEVSVESAAPVRTMKPLQLKKPQI